VEWFILGKKRKMIVPVNDPFNLGNVLWLVISEVAAVVGGRKGLIFST
jgi:hypothetical protein